MDIILGVTPHPYMIYIQITIYNHIVVFNILTVANSPDMLTGLKKNHDVGMTTINSSISLSRGTNHPAGSMLVQLLFVNDLYNLYSTVPYMSV